VLDTAPKEPEWQSWCYVAIGVLVIYCTIPVARALREFIAEQVGLDLFLYVTATLALIAGVMAFINLRRRRLPTDAYLFLFIIISAFMAYIYQLRDIPEEAIHVAEYGAIGILVYRALAHRTRDFSIYIMATLIVGMIGVLDEYIQWIVPSRVFDLRDIRTNFIAGGMGQLAIVAGLRPRIIVGLPNSKSWSRLCYTLALGLMLLVLGFLNTPQRIAWYASEIPAISFLLDSKSMMVEYGYLYQDEEIGIFRSRFSPDELKRLNAQRGIEVAGILDEYIRGKGYRQFLSRFTVPRDAYAHEAGVHLFRRNRYFDRAQKSNTDQGVQFNIAYRENQILSRYFPEAISKSGHSWSEELEQKARNHARETTRYDSPVSAGIITRLSERQVISLFSTMILVLLVLGFFTGRNSKTI
jgi:VanZ family protein